MANDFNRGIRVYLDTSDYGKGLEEMSSKTKQYEKELAGLTEKAENLAQAGKNSGKEWNKLQKEIHGKTNQLKAATTAEGKYRQKLEETEKILKNLSGATYRELTAARKQVREEMQRTERSSAKYKAAQEQLVRVDGELAKAQKDLNSQTGCQGTFMGKAAGWVNKYMGLIGGAVAAVTGLSLTFRRLSEDVARMDDVYSDVMKTTGMTRDEVLELNESFKRMDTRTSREELNGLARDAGKLGISGKKDILDFVDAGNQIRVALGEDLGEDAINSIGKMTSVFEQSSKELQGLDLKGRMLAVGSAVNELGASSTASEPYLVSFAGRLGGVAKQAGISMSAILGFASSLDQDMQQVEMSATALQNFILKLMSEPAKFAKIAGKDVKEFTALLNADANEAIKTVLRSLNAKGSFQELAPIFKEMGTEGARAVGVLSSLAGSVDQVEEAQRIANQAMLEGSSLTNEYHIKNNNLQAQLEKARKAFKETSLELGERLNPFLLKSTKGTTYLIRALVELPKWLKENAGLIVSLTVAMAAYTIAVNASVVADKLKVFWTNRIAASLKKLWAVISKNPWGALFVILGLVIGKIIDYYRELNSITEAERTLEKVRKKTASQYDEQAAKIDLLNRKLHDEKVSLDERKEALEKLRELIPNYHAELTAEGTLINDNKTAIDHYLVSLEKQIRMQAAQEELEELFRKKRLQERVVGEKETGKQTAQTNLNRAKLNTYSNSSYQGLSTQGTRMLAYNAGTGQEESALKLANKELNTAKSELTEILTAISAIENEIRNTPISVTTGEFKEGDEKLIDGVLMVYKNGGWVRKAVNPVKRLPEDRQKAIDKFIADSKVPLDIETHNYNERLKAAGIFGLSLDKMNVEQRARKIELDREYYNNLFNIQTEAENRMFEEQKKSMGLGGKRETLSSQQLEALEMLEQQHAANLAKIDDARTRQSVDNANALAEARLTITRENNNALSSLAEAAYQADLLRLKEMLAGKLISQEQYSQAERRLTMETAKARLAVAESSRNALLLLDDTPERRKEIETLLAEIQQLKGELAGLQTGGNGDAERKDIQFDAGSLSPVTSAADTIFKQIEALQKGNLDSWQDWANSVGSIVQNGLGAISGIVTQMEEAATARVTAEYAKRQGALTEQYNQGILSQEEYNAEKERLDYEQRVAELEVQKKYADVNFAIQVAQIGSALALGIMQAWASSMALGPIAGPIAAGVLTTLLIGASALQISAAEAERDRVKAMTIESPSGGGSGKPVPAGTRVAITTGQAAGGRYDALGAQDGRTYRNVPYRGVMRTGVVSRPTLVGEQGDEVVIDHPTLNNLRVNAPHVIDAIMQNRVAQRAEGNYSPIAGSGNPVGAGADAGLVSRLTETMETTNRFLNRLMSDPLMAYVVLSQLEATQQLRDKSLKKGSLK